MNLGIFSLFTVVNLCFFVVFFRKGNYAKCIIFSSLELAVVAFFSAPNITDDLYRHLEIINRWKGQSIEIITYDGYFYVYLNNLIMYLVAQIGIPELYQAIFTFIGYYYLQKMVLLFSIKNNISSKRIIWFLIAVFILLSFYKTYIMAIRNYFCFIVGAYYSYKYMYDELNLPMYLLVIVLLALIHPVSLFFFAIILYKYLCSVFDKNKVFLCASIVLIIHRFFLEILVLILPNDLFLIYKIKFYLDLDSPYNINFLIYYFFLISFGLIIYFILKVKKSATYIDDILALVCILSVSTIYKFELLKRFCYLIPLFLIDPLSKLISSDYKITELIKIKKETKLHKIKLNEVVYFMLCALSLASILATIANINAYGWYWRF